MEEQHKIKSLVKSMLFIKNIVTKLYAKIEFVLHNPKIFIPPIYEMIIEKVKRRKTKMDHPFYKCNIRRDIKVFFDIGANIGNVTLSAYRSFPFAQIHSFEPVRTTYQKLCKNVENYRERITTYNFGFFNVSKTLDIHITTFHGANSILNQSPNYKIVHPHIKEIGTENIELRTIDSFMSNKNIDKIDIIKIDVEGVEKEVIEGGQETFKNKVNNVFIELSLLRRNQEPEYWVEICKLLYNLGFVLINIYDIGRYIKDNREYLAQMDAFFTKQN